MEHPLENQLSNYRTDGYLLVPSLLDNVALVALRSSIQLAAHDPSAGKTHERDGDTMRILYGVHGADGLLSRIVRHPKVLALCERILGEPVYLYQSKVNFKAAFIGSGFEWHQDFAFWRNRDGLPRPSVVNVVMFLDEVNVFNGPIFLLPGSHQAGLIEGDRNLVPRNRVAELASRHGLFAATGQPGTALFFGGLMVHGSPPNSSPFDRALLLLTYSGVSNVVDSSKCQSPAHLAATDSLALKPLALNEIFRPDEVEEAR